MDVAIVAQCLTVSPTTVFLWSAPPLRQAAVVLKTSKLAQTMLSVLITSCVAKLGGVADIAPGASIAINRVWLSGTCY